ncbi:helix-turn-helix domain-containing protein [Maribacter cobaltidurans]|uniref:AraC family transcriptional regulator n=1 Tax=Maribacter cobaltidurans TaxID=1178778 RepID=A0A223V8D1_9FLAO|nr:helix-turn-helix domain-containing protein [Maribacter cobaltidurans]ASV31654.1 AraC family transcriptional regulator [Maribacter cobaltidurans]GGD94063.1 AraC family transcriptional regulator [Maribacter cobaltidurans]
MADSKDYSKIPSLTTSQFDEFLFPGWKPPNYPSYHKFHITRIEEYAQHLKVPVLPHRRTVNFFIFLTQGKAVRSKGLNSYEILPGHFYFLPADQITSLEYVSKDIAGFYCHFSSEIFQETLLKINLEKDFAFFRFNASPLVKIKELGTIPDILKILEDEYRKGDTNRFDLIPMYLATLLKEVNKQVDISSMESKPHLAALKITEQYKDALQRFIREKKTVAEYADYLSVSKNHLHKCVKSVTGKSAHSLLANMRILESKVLLRQTDLSIAEVAFNVGKVDQSDFTRFFKTQTGMTPREYRSILK